MTQIGVCTVCEQPTRSVCSGCRDAPFENPPTLYCGKKCQKEDWKNHKSTCFRLRNIKLLNRVATMAQKFWLVCREYRWLLFSITRVGTVAVDLPPQMIKCGPLGTRESLEDIKDGDLVFIGSLKDPLTYRYIRFPAEKFLNQRDQEAVLSFAGGQSAIKTMIEFIDGFLKGIVTKTERIEHLPKGTIRRTKFAPCCSRKFRKSPELSQLLERLNYYYHVVLKVTLNSGEEFAIDLAGAQYGHHQPVIPWDEFRRTRVLELTSTVPAPAPHYLMRIDDYSVYAMHKLNVKLETSTSEDQYIIDASAMLMRLWQFRNIGFKDLWNLPMEDFLRRNREVVDFISWMFNSPTVAVRRTMRGKMLRNIYPHAWPHRTT